MIGTLLLTLSSVTPASSVFVIVPGVIQQAGTGALLSMVAAAFLSFPIAFVYAELASAFPIAGGEYCMLGRTLGPAWGFAMLGLILVGNMLTPAVLALGAGVYMGAVFPGLDPTAVAIVIIVATTIFGILHIRTNAWVTGAFLLLEILALFVLAGLGFLHAQRSVTTLAFHPVALVGGALQPTPLALIGLATAVSVFAYYGFSSAIYFTEEMHEAPRLIGRTILWATIVTVLTELIPVLAVLVGAPDLKSLMASQSPFSDFVRQLGGDLLNKAISLSVAIAIINAVLATVLQNARFLFSTGRDAAWHANVNDALTRTHSRFHSPWFATLAAGGSSLVMCFLGMNLLLVLTGTGIVLTYAGVCAATLAGRRNGATAHAAFRMKLYPFSPILGLIALAYILYTNWLDANVGRPSLIANVVAILLSLAYYVFVLRARGQWILRDPEDDPDA
ncbi:MAG TPA: APC family permease [Rhizomicrobium sp.]|nr:APC family permease [Rhizomicrobium sp.]